MKCETPKNLYPDFKGLFVPADIYLDRRLKPVERIYLAVLRQYPETEADYMMKCSSKEKGLDKVKQSLIDKGYSW